MAVNNLVHAKIINDKRYCNYIFRSMATLSYFLKGQGFYRLFTTEKRETNL